MSVNQIIYFTCPDEKLKVFGDNSNDVNDKKFDFVLELLKIDPRVFEDEDENYVESMKTESEKKQQTEAEQSNKDLLGMEDDEGEGEFTSLDDKVDLDSFDLWNLFSPPFNLSFTS